VSKTALKLAGFCLSIPALVLLAALFSGHDGHAIDLDAVLNGISGLYQWGQTRLI